MKKIFGWIYKLRWLFILIISLVIVTLMYFDSGKDNTVLALNNEVTTSVTEPSSRIVQLEQENKLLLDRIDEKNTVIRTMSVLTLVLIVVVVVSALNHFLKWGEQMRKMERLRAETRHRIKEKDAQLDNLVGINNASKEEKENTLADTIALKELGYEMLKSYQDNGSKIDEDFLDKIERRVYEITPRFINNLNDYNFERREYYDAILVKIEIPQKVCADIFKISAAGLANSRKRLLKKRGLDARFATWCDFVLSL